MESAVEHLPNVCGALGSIPRTGEKKKERSPIGVGSLGRGGGWLCVEAALGRS